MTKQVKRNGELTQRKGGVRQDWSVVFSHYSVGRGFDEVKSDQMKDTTTKTALLLDIAIDASLFSSY